MNNQTLIPKEHLPLQLEYIFNNQSELTKRTLDEICKQDCPSEKY